MGNTVIQLEDVGKTYQLGKFGGVTTIQESILNLCNRQRRQEKKMKRTFQALQHINLDIKAGERVAVIGRNGAGKSTLLKLLSRITTPDTGTIRIKGKISGMLEGGTGFHGELTGRENIYLNGSILGMKRREIDEKMDEIIEFSECKDFIDTPVKRYSSGMYVKLGFAVAAHLNADIFLMDEVLAVGDMMFQKKCLAKMREISENQDKTILYVSHNMETVRTLCERCIVLQKGELIFDGETEKGIQIYMQDVLAVKNSYQYERGRYTKKATNEVQIYQIDLKNPVLTDIDSVLQMNVFYSGRRNISGIHFRFTVHDAEDRIVGTGISESFSAKEGEEQKIIMKFDTESLVSGEYAVDLAVVEPRDAVQIRHDYLERALAFRVEKKEAAYRVAWSRREWGSIRFPELNSMRKGLEISKRMISLAYNEAKPLILSDYSRKDTWEMDDQTSIEELNRIITVVKDMQSAQRINAGNATSFLEYYTNLNKEGSERQKEFEEFKKDCENQIAELEMKRRNLGME